MGFERDATRPDLAWLTARPIAHRGLHDASKRVIENTLGAALGAIVRGFSIECDVLASADGEAVVFHDDTLERLTHADGPTSARTFEQLAALTLRGTDERIPSLRDLLEVIDGRVGLVIEMKSTFPRTPDDRIARAVAAALTRYRGPVATKSFDPDLVEAAHRIMPGIAHGVVAERANGPFWRRRFTTMERFGLTHLLHAPRTRPDFVSYAAADLPALAPWIARARFGRPVIAWTVRSAEERARIAPYVDQIVFEGFDPDAD